MNYQAIVFFDLDGTLLNEHSKVTPAVSEAMGQLKANNILPIIASGRTEPEITKIMTEAQIESDIVMNGAFIRIDGRPIYSELINKSICQRMQQAVQARGDQLSYYNETGIWCTGHSEDLINAYNFIHSPIPPIEPTAYQNRDINMLLVLGRDNEGYYEEQFPELNFYRNTPYSIDIVKKSVSKGHAVKIVKEKLGLNIPTYGFGDGPNDVALLSACDHKIAMENGKPELKAIADYVTGKNTGDGIVQGLKHYQLI